MNELKASRNSEKPARSGAQIFALVLAILFLLQVACGIFLIHQGVVEWMEEGSYYTGTTPVNINFETALGTVALTGLVPAILLLFLFVRITKARVYANWVGVAFEWLVVIWFGLVTGAFQGGIHPGFLLIVIAPVLYTVCVIFCARIMGRSSKVRSRMVSI
ncbi:MAG: hypothetical protein ACOYIK_06925 [Coriobacteriales bacterium]|jgi:hypothetical protein